MGSHRQRFLHDLPTFVAFLRGETRVHSDHLMTSSCSLIFKDSEECAPASVHDALCQGMILYHVENSQLLNRDQLIAFCIQFGCLIVKVSALTGNLEMGLCRTTGGLTASVTSLFAPTQSALFASQRLLRRAIEARVLNSTAFRVSQEGFQAYIDADGRMRAFIWSMFGMGLSLTDKQRIPMTVSPMDQMNSPGSSLYRTMHLDLEEFPQFSRNMQVFLVSIQPHITACSILSQLDGMPAVRLLEARETHIRNAQLSGREKTFERFGETICQHLYGGGRHILTPTAFELCCQIVLARKCPILLILLLHLSQHLVKELARLSQTSHEPAGLLLIRIQSKLKRSHILTIAIRQRNVNSFVLPVGGRQFIPLAEARGPLAVLW